MQKKLLVVAAMAALALALPAAAPPESQSAVSLTLKDVQKQPTQVRAVYVLGAEQHTALEIGGMKQAAGKRSDDERDGSKRGSQTSGGQTAAAEQPAPQPTLRL